ncbi:MAG: ECF-type sigma factor [Bryobacteraceae bacterium]|jgi:RNA polymerase sigma-70 factor, ECF subfamily
MPSVSPAPGEAQPDITRLLNEMAAGDAGAADALAPVLYPELHSLARHFVRKERSDHTLQSTALVNEAFLRLFRPQDRTWENRAHFFAVAAMQMRHILVDYARRRNARPDGHALSESDKALGQMRVEKAKYLVDLDDTLGLLEKKDPRQARIVELKFFLGLETDKIAEILQVSDRTIKREWAAAKKWLKNQMTAKKRG